MNKITFEQYRRIDLIMLSVLLVISEGLTTLATTKWFVAVPFAITTTLLFLCIGMMRWGGYSAVLAVVGGITFVVASGADFKRCVIYIIGNLFSLLALFYINAVGKNKLRRSIPFLVLYAVITYVSVCIGRWLVSLIFEPSLSSIVAYVFTDVITLLFTAVAIALMRNLDGMIEDQKEYVTRQAREREAERKKDSARLEEVVSDPNYLDDVFDEEDEEDAD